MKPLNEDTFLDKLIGVAFVAMFVGGYALLRTLLCWAFHGPTFSYTNDLIVAALIAVVALAATYFGRQDEE